MSQAVALPGQASVAPQRPSDSARGATRIGWLIILLFLGGGGYWAATAPLNAAVVGDAVIKVEGNRKSVEHLDGGTVKEVLVREGDHVKAGDIVLVLDDTYAKSTVDTLSQQQAQLLATEARLRAEFTGAKEIAMPMALLNALDGMMAAAAMQDQQHEFMSRREALEGKKAVLLKRIAQYETQMAGQRAQLPPLEDQLKSITAERASLDALLKQGLTTRTRALELERRESTIQGQMAEIQSNLNAADDAISELRAQIAQLVTDQTAQVTADLRDVTTRLADVTPKLEAAKVVLDRTKVRTPYAGTVVDLKVFSTGAVIGRGDRILDIVPEDTSLDIEAKIKVEDISDVAPGMTAEIHFTSYKQRTMPLIHGLVSEISADRLTDEKTQIPYYVAKVDVNADELAASPEIKLYPGMPATVMITTKERTALDYLVGPLLVSFDRSFRER